MEEKVDAQKVLAAKLSDFSITLTSKDTILYALGLGMSRDPLDSNELAYTYELHENFKILPTMM